MGSSSDKNCEALKRVPITHTLKSANAGQQKDINPPHIRQNTNVPVDGLSPNCTICLRLTPVAGKPE
jgi:hypothetical protein